jgi:hypothetical protein
MTSFKPGDVVLVSIPFTDQSGAKKRPGVVVSSEAYNTRTPDVIILPITSQIRRTMVFGEFTIAEWQAAGLLKPSGERGAITGDAPFGEVASV